MSGKVRVLEPFQRLTVRLVDGRTIEGIYTREQAALRMAWAILLPDYQSHTIIDWHCAWCDPRDKNAERSEQPLTSGICKPCSKKMEESARTGVM